MIELLPVSQSVIVRCRNSDVARAARAVCMKACIGCGRCAAVCQCDILFPSPEKGVHPLVIYPGECYYCGACVMACPRPGAITLNHPLRNRAKFVPVIPKASETSKC